MGRTSSRTKLILDEAKRTELKTIASSRTSAFRDVQRAKILLQFSDGISISQMEKDIKVSRPTIYKCIDKALRMGVDAGLRDVFHRPKAPVITDEAKAWVVNLACTKPKVHGYAAEMWSRKQLASHARAHGPAAGHPSLAKAAKATIQRILDQHPLRPHKMAYYMERRDPEFERKMQDVLMVYKEVNLTNDSLSDGDVPDIITVSIDEKPGVQALRNIAPEIPPNPHKNSRTMRDYEYKRLGTVSILAALDLNTGHVIGQVHDRHRSSEFVSLLKEIDGFYPPQSTIRVVLDNHSAHISKETMSYLATRPNRFQYVHTPKHGSWLNLVEMLFGKMARTFLKHIRVQSKDELKRRILLGIEEMNRAPVIFRWKKFGLELAY
jgi:transposase